MDTDSDANKALYGKDISANKIVTDSEPFVASAKPVVNLLDYQPENDLHAATVPLRGRPGAIK